MRRAALAPERNLVVLPGDAPGSYAYKASALRLSYRTMEVPVRIELTLRVLQTLALPLGYGTAGERGGSRTRKPLILSQCAMPIRYSSIGGLPQIQTETFSLLKRSPLSIGIVVHGQCGRIRTCDLMLPRHADYQTVLHTDLGRETGVGPVHT